MAKVEYLFIKNHSHKISAGNIIEKGTNRKEFVEGIVNKYEWQSLGSSYVLSDLQLYMDN